jgi:hypothetical protein
MVGFDEYNVVHYAIKRVDWLSRELDYPPRTPPKTGAEADLAFARF